MNLPRSPRLVRRGQRGAFAIIDAVVLLPLTVARWHGQLAASAVLSP